jgi:hypothetical protein
VIHVTDRSGDLRYFALGIQVIAWISLLSPIELEQIAVVETRVRGSRKATGARGPR